VQEDINSSQTKYMERALTSARHDDVVAPQLRMASAADRSAEAFTISGRTV